MARLASIIALLLSAAALVVSFARPSEEPRESEPLHRRERPVRVPEDLPRRADPAGGAVELEARMASLEWTLFRVSQRLQELEQGARGGKVGEAQAPLASEELRELRRDLDAVLLGSELGTDAGRARVKDAIRALQDEVFVDRMRERLASLEGDRHQRWKQFAEDARLNFTQEQDLTALLDGEARRRTETWDAVRQGTKERREAFRDMRSMREVTDAAAQRILSDEQLGKYQSVREEERADWRGRPWVPGDGGIR